MKSLFVASLLALTAMGSARAAIPEPGYLIDPGKPRIEQPDSIVQRYTEAVERGELSAFGLAIDRSMIVPVRVEYVYDLASRTTRVKVYSTLKTPLQVPKRECKIRALGAIMEDGRIVEIESHIWMEE